MNAGSEIRAESAPILIIQIVEISLDDFSTSLVLLVEIQTSPLSKKYCEEQTGYAIGIFWLFSQ